MAFTKINIIFYYFLIYYFDNYDLDNTVLIKFAYLLVKIVQINMQK